MKKIILFLILGTLAACGSQDNDIDKQEEVKEETMEKLKDVQELNVELEQIDGELDSLINSIN